MVKFSLSTCLLDLSTLYGTFHDYESNGVCLVVIAMWVSYTHPCRAVDGIFWRQYSKRDII